ncbi:MAG: response regulator [Thalassobaculum sp.]|uniref:response regulator n=1 Tax=Thalassobaculum sp. TaxID=2022740 RepID=UPI0032EB791F
MKAYDLSGMSVLVVDPNTFMRDILRELLDGLGVGQILGVKSIADATNRLAEYESIDLVLTELDLDTRDGVDLIRAIREHREQRIRMLPVLVITADTRMPRIVASRDAGATEFLAKPVSAEAIYKRLVQLIERPRPFVRVDDEYFGPDRRRQMREFMGGERRGGLPEAQPRA